jgi:hypothetical protein
MSSEIDALRQALDLDPAELDLDQLRPVLVPASFFEADNWPGPHLKLGTSGIGLTWVVLQPSQTMLYVSNRAQAYWEASGLDWRQRALANVLGPDELAWTHEFKRGSGSIYAVAMMHEDGIGPSRLLVPSPFRSLFPEGYSVALPEMSCGFAFSARLQTDEQQQIDSLITRCHVNGTRPLASGSLAAETFLSLLPMSS